MRETESSEVGMAVATVDLILWLCVVSSRQQEDPRNGSPVAVNEAEQIFELHLATSTWNVRKCDTGGY